MTRKSLLVLCATIVVLSMGGIAGSMWLATSPFAGRSAAARSSASIGGPFTLTAADGTSVTDRTYRGKWLLIYFGYTFCPDACPTALNNLSDALQQLGPLAGQVRPLFVTVDPRRDTPKVMADYLKAFDHRIVGLTGTADEITTVAREYGVYIAPQKSEGAGYLIDHSSFIYVMGPQGKFAAVLSGSASGGQMADRLKQLVSRTS